MESIQKKRQEKGQGDKESVKGKSRVFKQAFGFFHDFLFAECFPEKDEKVEEDQRRKIEEGL